MPARKRSRCRRGHYLDLPDAVRVWVNGRGETIKICRQCEAERRRAYQSRILGRPIRRYRRRQTTAADSPSGR